MEIKRLIGKIEKFRKERDWKQFHKPKDVAISLMLEAAELLEHFQWKSDKEIKKYIKDHKGE
ncbi:MAG: nucleotide pyrophosphohydrolase, partial [Nitrospirota bacterium]